MLTQTKLATGGIKEAYLAYQKYATENGHEPRLPGLNYTTNQLFWISAAQTWCNVYRPEAMKMRITTGVHSPGQFRVLGPLSNMREFSKDFNCPEGKSIYFCTFKKPLNNANI